MRKRSNRITKEERAEHIAWLKEQKKLDKAVVKQKPTKGIID